MKLTMHTGAHWQVELPADWILKNDNQGVLKFKSSDGNYGLDIAVWNIQTMERTEQDILNQFSQTAMKVLDEMQGYQWSHNKVLLGAGDLLVDSLDADRLYRVVNRLIVDIPLVLNAGFHDYECTDINESNACLTPLLQTVYLT